MHIGSHQKTQRKDGEVEQRERHRGREHLERWRPGAQGSGCHGYVPKRSVRERRSEDRNIGTEICTHTCGHIAAARIIGASAPSVS